MINFKIEHIILIIFVIVLLYASQYSEHFSSTKPNNLGILEQFASNAQIKPDDIAILKQGKNWEPVTWAEYYQTSCRVANYLGNLGVNSGDRVCLIGPNSYELFCTCFGVMLAGAVHVVINPDASSENLGEIIAEVTPVHIFLDNRKDANSITKIASYLGKNTPITSLAILGQVPKNLKTDTKIYNWVELVQSSSLELKNKTSKIACLIYTSGSTGKQKPVIITYDNLQASIFNILDRLHQDGVNLGKNIRTISYLPISHVATQILDLYAPIYLSSSVYIASIKLAQSKKELIKILKQVRPTMFGGVPRIWEKIGEIINAQDKSLFDSILEQFYKSGKIREKIGLDKTKFCISFGAPLSSSLVYNLKHAGIFVYDSYGLTETAGPVAMSTSMYSKPGSVGKILNNIQIKTQDNIIWVKSPTVSPGYFNNLESTKQVFQDGWFNTGDIGYLDEYNYLFITGRSKDIIITSGGENISPEILELKLKEELFLISCAVLVGDGQKYLIVLLVPKLEIAPTGEPTIMFTKPVQNMLTNLGSKTTTIVEAEDDVIIKNLIDQVITKINNKAPNKSHQIKKWVLLSSPLTKEEITSSLKVNRQNIIKKNKKLIDKLHNFNKTTNNNKNNARSRRSDSNGPAPKPQAEKQEDNRN